MHYPTKWRVEDLHVGMVIYNPPMKEVDPRTRQCTDQLARFIVTARTATDATFEPYHGDEPAAMPPD